MLYLRKQTPQDRTEKSYRVCPGNPPANEGDRRVCRRRALVGRGPCATQLIALSTVPFTPAQGGTPWRGPRPGLPWHQTVSGRGPMAWPPRREGQGTSASPRRDSGCSHGRGPIGSTRWRSEPLGSSGPEGGGSEGKCAAGSHRSDGHAVPAQDSEGPGSSCLWLLPLNPSSQGGPQQGPRVQSRAFGVQGGTLGA